MSGLLKFYLAVDCGYQNFSFIIIKSIKLKIQIIYWEDVKLTLENHRKVFNLFLLITDDQGNLQTTGIFTLEQSLRESSQ